jgi:hypothetical protein
VSLSATASLAIRLFLELETALVSPRWTDSGLRDSPVKLLVWKMIAEANAQLPDEKKFSWFWWTPSKHIRLWEEHKRLCADSRWRLVAIFSLGSDVIFMILFIASFRVHPR